MIAAATVRPMTADEFARWIEAEVVAYAQELVDAGIARPGDALARSRQQHRDHLPLGLATPGMHLLRVLDVDGSPVGMLWVGPHPRRPGAGFVYDIAVDEEHRGRGFGRRAMLAAEAIARREGWEEIALNVFGRNRRARRLYESLGYAVINTNMTKRLA